MKYTNADTDEAINRAVHEKVMRLCWHNFHPVSGGYGSACSKCGEGYDGPYDDNPTYTTDLNSAFEAQRVAVEKLKATVHRPHRFFVEALAEALNVRLAEHWEPYADATFYPQDLGKLIDASAKDRCLAVLAACGVEREEI